MSNYLSIDVGGTYVKFGLVDRSGNFIETWKIETPKTLETFKTLIYEQIERQANGIQGIAMSCPGRVDSINGYIQTGGSLIFLYDFAISKWIKTVTDLPFSVINDGKAAALSEWWIGNLKEVENGGAIVLGTGVGGGLILNNQLYQGPTFQAGELSFLIHYPMGETTLQMFGKEGSAVGFMNQAAKLLAVEPHDYEAIFRNLAEGSDMKLYQLFKDYCKNIAIQIVNLQVILNLEKIVIGGGISAQDLVVDTIKKEYEAIFQTIEILGATFEPLEIEACAFRNSSNLLGAVYQLFQIIECNT